jgi:hypothetical protein
MSESKNNDKLYDVSDDADECDTTPECSEDDTDQEQQRQDQKQAHFIKLEDFALVKVSELETIKYELGRVVANMRGKKGKRIKRRIQRTLNAKKILNRMCKDEKLIL